MLTKEQILAADDIKTEVVDVPEWGGQIRIKTLTGAELDAYEVSMVGDGKKRDMSNLRAGLIARAVVDESGKRMFSDSDISALGAKSGIALDRVFTAVQKLNPRSDKDLKELEKNSGTIPGDDSVLD